MKQSLSARCLLAVIASLAVLSTSPPIFAQKPGKGGGGDGGSTLPPVRYQVQFWTVPASNYVYGARDMNHSGQSVGFCDIGSSRRAFLYDPNVDLEFAVDLNAIVSNIPQGWAIRSATAINEFGQIAAYIEPINAPGEFYQAVMIDMNQNLPLLKVIPDDAFTSHSIAGDINNWGDIAVRYRRNDGTWGQYVYNFDAMFGITAPVDLNVSAAYDPVVFINDDRVIVGERGNYQSYRRTYNGDEEVFTEFYPSAMNAGAAFCGRANLRLKGNKTSQSGFLFDTELEVISSSSNAHDVNDSLDCIFNGKLLHRTYGVVDVFALLDPSDPDRAVMKDSGHFFIWRVTNREPVTEFPVISGTYKGTGFTLTPIPAP